MNSETNGYHNVTEPEIEGIRMAIISLLDENVLTYIYKKKLMFNDQHNIYHEYLRINADTNMLFAIYNDDSLSESERNTQIIDVAHELYDRLKKLVITVNESAENDSDTEINNENNDKTDIFGIFPLK